MIKTYRAVLPPWRLSAIRWPLLHRTIGTAVAVFTFQLGNKRLVVTSA